MEFSANLKYLRKLKGLTQEQLGQILALTNTAISNWEQGTSHPDVFTALKLSIYFGISVNDMFDSDLRNGEIKVREPDLNKYHPPGTCELCSQKDQTIEVLNKLANTQQKHIDILDARLNDLEIQRGQKRKAV